MIAFCLELYHSTPLVDPSRDRLVVEIVRLAVAEGSSGSWHSKQADLVRYRNMVLAKTKLGL